MAVGVQMDFKSVTLDQYDEVINKMGFDPGGEGPPQCIFHWAAKTEEGLRVTDVWETKEAFDDFAENKIGPLTAEAGITEPPRMRIFEVHNYLTGS